MARHPETELLVWPEVPPSLSCSCAAGKGQGDFVRRLGKALLFACVEYRIPLVRVTNTGYGAYVHPSGAIRAGTLTPPGQAMITSAAVRWRPGVSFYAVRGDVFLTLVGCGFLGLLAGQGIRALAGGTSSSTPGALEQQVTGNAPGQRDASVRRQPPGNIR